MTIIFMMIISSGFKDQTEKAEIMMGNYFIAFVLGITFISIVIYFILSSTNK